MTDSVKSRDTSAGGFVDRSARGRVNIGGPDRLKFLHNLTTNEVKKLGAGKGQESFVTSPQGKTLGYVTLLALEDRIVLRTAVEGLPPVLAHLRKYGVFDDVSIDDVSGSTCEFHLFGDDLGESGQFLGIESSGVGEYDHVASQTFPGFLVVRESPTGLPGLTLIGPAESRDELMARMEKSGLARVDPDVFEALRIEAGTPEVGREVKPENLPQELDRDDRAISFVKGCYLGQETVARLDAMGHVNKILRGGLVSGELPVAGTPLTLDGKPVGTVTSSAYSPRLGRGVLLAYVRTANASPGTLLTAESPTGGPAPTVEISALPMNESR
ncbi:glycine cleavage T C-terminal barrel domain-containing protein [Isosphaeraceae bacterium EP7]